LGVNAFCRAYIYFKDYDEIFSFRDRFDNYVFVDSKSNEYPAIVEFAPYQRRFKFSDTQKKDSKCNTIGEDSDYLKFLEQFDKPSGQVLPSCETILEEIEQREQERNENAIGIMTPLLEYMKKKREDKKAALREVSLDLERHRSWVCNLWDWVNLTHELVKLI
jgi:regulator of nonsense transcripts 3